jgi:hypothetical protein
MVPAMRSQPFDAELLAPLDDRLTRLLDDLVWWARALAAARQSEAA